MSHDIRCERLMVKGFNVFIRGLYILCTYDVAYIIWIILLILAGADGRCELLGGLA